MPSQIEKEVMGCLQGEEKNPTKLTVILLGVKLYTVYRLEHTLVLGTHTPWAANQKGR